MKKKKFDFAELVKYLIQSLVVGLCAFFGVTLSGCGVTRASVSKPAQGTTTTITITTNNPITTDVSPDVKLNGKEK